jgi:hypothetical protein
VTKLLTLLITFYVFISCKQEYAKCDIQTNDNSLRAYNEILNEIIINHTYSRYLGQDVNRIFEKYPDDIADSNNIQQEILQLHIERFNDTSRFCTIYLDTSLKLAISPWWYSQKDTNSFRLVLRNLIKRFSDNEQSVLDTLNSIQTKYSAKDFKLCIANLISIKKLKEADPKCYIGKIAFSKLLLNAKEDKGILYYEFRCGELCGYGSVILIEKVNEHWRIESDNMTWIS